MVDAKAHRAAFREWYRETHSYQIVLPRGRSGGYVWELPDLPLEALAGNVPQVWINGHRVGAWFSNDSPVVALTLALYPRPGDTITIRW